MTESEREWEVGRLTAALAEAKKRRAELLEEVVHFAARFPEIRREFGNPFFYSNPEEPDEGIANYTGNASHEVTAPTMMAFMRAVREVERIRAELRRLEDDGTTC